MKGWIIGTAALVLGLGLAFSANAQTQKVKRVPGVGEYLYDTSVALKHLQKGDLAKMEASLDRGFLKIKSMMDSPTPETETNEKGWGQLVWTQLMYRLQAIQDGVYDRELEFAERVALEGVAKGSLRLVERSVGRIRKLLEAKEVLGLDRQVDAFARGMFADDNSVGDYEAIIADFQERFRVRQEAVLARLESGKHPGIVDPDGLPAGSQYSAYAKHRARLKNEDFRLDEVFNVLAQYDPERVVKLAETRKNASSPTERREATNEIKVQLLVLEDALDAAENDPAVQDLIGWYERVGYLAFDQYSAGPDDFQELMVLIHRAKAVLKDQTQPETLRALYAMGAEIQ